MCATETQGIDSARVLRYRSFFGLGATDSASADLTRRSRGTGEASGTRIAGCHRALGICLATLFTGCVLVPGETRVPEYAQFHSQHHYYHAPKSPDLEGSHVLGVPKLNPKWWLANSDDPLPWWWKPDASVGERKRSWFLRNPCHNFTHYIVGVKDRSFHRIGVNAQSIWNDNGGFNAALSQVGPLMYLPMVSHRGRYLEWYLGWRESGTFGVALRRAQPDSDGTGPRGRSPLANAMPARERSNWETTSAQAATKETTATGCYELRYSEPLGRDNQTINPFD